MGTATTSTRRAWLTGEVWRDGGRGSREDRAAADGPAGATRAAGDVVIARRAMACEFSLRLPGSTPHAFDVGCAALDEIDRLEHRLTVYDDASDVAHLNRTAAEHPTALDAELSFLLRMAGRLHAETGGAFDVAAGALVRAWGFLRGPRRVPAERERAAALALSGWRHVRLDDERDRLESEDGALLAFDQPGVELNLGAIGKGFAIDRALDVVRTQHGVATALLQGGQSSLRAMGEPPGGWVVALGDPRRSGAIVARVRLHDQALGTSGADNQFFEADGRRFGHVLDPRTGWPAEGLRSASVVAASAAEADALSTALFVMGRDEAQRFCDAHPEIGAVLVLADEVVVLGAADVEVTT